MSHLDVAEFPTEEEIFNVFMNLQKIKQVDTDNEEENSKAPSLRK